MMMTQEIVDQTISKMKMMTLFRKNRIRNDTFRKEHHFQKRKGHSTLEKTF